MSQATEGGIAQGQVLLLTTDDHSYAFDLWEHFRISLGRHRSNDVPLVSRKVSNYHAEILNEGDGWLLRDLGSTNGLFINDEPVRERRLNQGDRIRIGGYELKVHLKARDGSQGAGKALPVGARGQLAPVVGQPAGIVGGRAKGQVPTLADLLRLLSNKVGTGLLEIQNHRSAKGKIFADAGQVIHSELGEVSGEKALYRLFRWSEASSRFWSIRSPPGFDTPLSFPPTRSSRRASTSQRMGQDYSILPPFLMALRLNEDCPLPLWTSPRRKWEIFQASSDTKPLARYWKIRRCRISGFSPLSTRCCKRKSSLSPKARPLLEQTFIHRPG